MPPDNRSPIAMTLRARVWRALEEPKSRIGRAVSALLVLLILANALSVVIGSVDAIEAEYGGALDVFEAISVTIFSVEYAARLWASAEAGTRWRWVFSPFAIIDLLAILPSILGALFGAYFTLDLRQLRILRLARLAKLSRHFAPLEVLFAALRAEARPMAAAMAIMFGLIIVAASLVYQAEHIVQPEAFGDIPRAMWWAAVTLTTVGYGDAAPVTLVGRLIAVGVMTCGVGMVALPAGMLASRFSDELATRRRKAAEAAARSAASGHVSIDRTDPKVGPGEACCPHCGGPLASAPAAPPGP